MLITGRRAASLAEAMAHARRLGAPHLRLENAPALAKSLIRRPEAWLFTRGEDMQGEGVAAAILRRGRFLRNLHLLATPHLVGGAPELERIQDFARDRGVANVAIEWFGEAGPEHVAGETWRQSRPVYVLDLSGPAGEDDLSRHHRRLVRKAQKSGVTRIDQDPRKAALDHVRLCSASLSRRAQRGETVDVQDPLRGLGRFLATGRAFLLQAGLDGTVLSSNLVVILEDAAFYLSGGTDPRGMQLGVAHYLMNELIDAVRGLGCTSCNLGYTDGEGLARFKEGFGATPLPATSIGMRWDPPTRQLVSAARGLVTRLANTASTPGPDSWPEGAPGTHPPTSWQVERGVPGVAALASPWNALAHRPGAPPTNDAIFVGALWKAIGSRNDRALHVHGLFEGDRLRGLLPLVRSGGWLRTWTDVWDVRFTPQLAATLDETLPGLGGHALQHLFEGADCLELHRADVISGGPRRLLDAARERGLPVVVVPMGGDAYARLDRAWEEVRAGLPNRLRKNTEQAIRRLERDGELLVERTTDRDRVDALVTECFELEALGWKATSGWTVLHTPEALQFYTELARAELEAGRLGISTLRHDGKLIAYEYLVRSDDRIDLLKCSYHPDYAKLSPSNVLRFLIWQEEIERGEIRRYHFGGTSDWKKRWSAETSDLVCLRIYSDGLRGRLGYFVREQVREWLREIAWVREAVAGLRNRVRSATGRGETASPR